MIRRMKPWPLSVNDNTLINQLKTKHMFRLAIKRRRYSVIRYFVYICTLTWIEQIKFISSSVDLWFSWHKVSTLLVFWDIKLLYHCYIVHPWWSAGKLKQKTHVDIESYGLVISFPQKCKLIATTCRLNYLQQNSWMWPSSTKIMQGLSSSLWQ